MPAQITRVKNISANHGKVKVEQLIHDETKLPLIIVYNQTVDLIEAGYRAQQITDAQFELQAFCNPTVAWLEDLTP